MNKYRAVSWYDKNSECERFFVERTHPVYGFPAVEIPTQPQFLTLNDAKDFAKRLNGDVEQMSLFPM